MLTQVFPSLSFFKNKENQICCYRVQSFQLSDSSVQVAANVSSSALPYLNKQRRPARRALCLRVTVRSPTSLSFLHIGGVSEVGEMPTQDQHSPFRNIPQDMRSWNSALMSSQAHSQGPFEPFSTDLEGRTCCRSAHLYMRLGRECPPSCVQGLLSVGCCRERAFRQ